jgi:hypothetical protein
MRPTKTEQYGTYACKCLMQCLAEPARKFLPKIFTQNLLFYERS